MRAAAGILAVLLGAALAAQAPPGGFDVNTFGAARDGRSNAAASIQPAIDACAGAGGGTVYFPAGHYLSGTIRLKSNVNAPSFGRGDIVR